jgi:hypothetical protein
VGDEAKWYQLDGSELLRPWILNWGWGIRDSSRLVQKSKKQYTCVLGCPIKPGEKYARFELQSERYLSIGICSAHISQFSGGNETEWFDKFDVERFFRGLK